MANLSRSPINCEFSNNSENGIPSDTHAHASSQQPTLLAPSAVSDNSDHIANGLEHMRKSPSDKNAPSERKQEIVSAGMSSSVVTESAPLPDYTSSTSPTTPGSHDEMEGLSKPKSAGTISQLPGRKQGKNQPEEKADRPSIMVQNGFGVTQNFSRERRNDNQNSSPLSSYLILSPSNPIRILAISFLTHWIYSTVILIAISAFIISSVYCSHYKKSELIEEVTLLQKFTRWLLLITILLEILIKSIARGLIIQKSAYLRISWDWLDILSVIFLFVSIIIPRPAVEFVAAAVLILKLIPIHPGSINAFIFLCSCAKKLIPLVLYGIIIVWIYGVVIFTLFVKYQHNFENDLKTSETNGSTRSDTGNDNITRKSSVEAEDKDTLAQTTFQNNSFGLLVECLPTNFRSLSGSFIQAMQMLTLSYSSGTSINLSSTSSPFSCQLEIYTLSILETLTVISGTLPIISMSFAVLCHFFQNWERRSHANRRQEIDGDMEEYQAEHYNRHYIRRRTATSLRSNSSQAQEQNVQRQTSNDCFSDIAKVFCDCDYYFCCLANLQRKLSPYSARIFNSKLFKVSVVLLVLTDLVCMIVLLWYSKLNTDSPFIWLITWWIQVCFILYTIESTCRWFSISSDEYWKTCWSAFDLSIVIIYWIGYAAIHARSYYSYYPKFCGILMIRMLKIVPYWNSLDDTLKLIKFSVLGSRHNLCVILICSLSAILLKYAFFTLALEETWKFFTVQLQPDLICSNPFVETIFMVVFQYFSLVTMMAIFMKVPDAHKPLRKGLSTSITNPSVSLLVNHNHFDNLSQMEPRRSLNDSSPISEIPIPNGVHHNPNNSYRISLSSANGLLLHDSKSFLSPSSDVLSPLLSIPIPNGINGYAHAHAHDDVGGIDSENVRRTEQTCVWLRSCFPSNYIQEDMLNLASLLVVILSSVNVVLENDNEPMNWRSFIPGKSLWIEIIFISCIALHIVYRTRLKRFSRETFLQICSILDLIIILAAAFRLFDSGMKWVPTKSRSGSVNVLLDCAKILSACRALLLLSRISWLGSVGAGLCSELHKILKFVAASGYIWLIFIYVSIEVEEIIMEFTSGKSVNISQVADASEHLNIQSNIDNSTEASISTNEVDSRIHPFLLLILLAFFVLNMGLILGLFYSHFDGFTLNQLYEKFMTTKQMAQYRLKIYRRQFGFLDSEPEQITQPTQGTCVPMLYFVGNHNTFDICVMIVIIFDSIGITFEYFASEERGLILRKHYPAYMLFMYSSEILAKISGNGLKFFKSYWNIFDCIIITICLSDFFLGLVYQHWVITLLQNVRFLRIMRIFQFQPFIRRGRVITIFFDSIIRIMPVLWNHSIFYLCLYLSALTFRLACAHIAISCSESVSELGQGNADNRTPFWIAAPFTPISIKDIFDFLENPVPDLGFRCIFYIFNIVIFLSIRLSVVFSICIIVVATICQILREQDLVIGREFRSHDHLYLEDKSSYMMPCISPETMDMETSSSAGTSSRVNNVSRCMDMDQSGCVYEESSGCKVFFVEAMITTV